MRQANRYISVFKKHEEGKNAYDPDRSTFASASNDSGGSRTKLIEIDFTDEKTGTWHGKMHWTKKGRFSLSRRDEEIVERMEDDNVCRRIAIDVAKLAFGIAVRASYFVCKALRDKFAK